MDAQLNIPRKC